MNHLLHHCFENDLEKKYGSIAVIEEDGREATYEELNKIASYYEGILSDYFKKEGAIGTCLVGIISYINTESIAALLGILKSGNAYVPLDFLSPPDRIKKIIIKANIKTVVIQDTLLSKFHDFFAECYINLIILNSSSSKKIKIQDYPTLNKRNKCHKILRENLAYVLHSSGSTGTPKGIMLTHQNARTFVDWMQKTFNLTREDIVISRSPLNFDLSVFDIFTTLLAGASILCFDWGKERKINKHVAYVKLLEEKRATFLYTTPSTLICLMHNGELGKQKNHLRTVMYAGEPFPVAKLKEFSILHPDTRVANIYGPTETNIITYFWIDKINDEWKSVPLGKVIDDTEIIVVNNSQKKICNTNETGELWCRGGSVTIGYLGEEGLTQKHRIKSPFHSYPVYYWRTGDYGYLDNNGNLQYKGRKDHIIKLKGYRIELGEIEASLTELSVISEACVVYINKPQPRLLCFYSTKSNYDINHELIDLHLKKTLPKYMIPEMYFYYYELPKTSSGKIDRMLLTRSYEDEKLQHSV